MTTQAQEIRYEILPVGDWRQRAACATVDPELFFPTAVDGPVLAEQEAAAKAVCRTCPVRAECRRWALAALPHGIAGGLTEDERAAVRRGRARAAAAREIGTDGSRGGHRAPVLISHSNSQAGTAAEGHRG